MKRNKIILLTALSLLSTGVISITSCNETKQNQDTKVTIATPSKTTLLVGDSLELNIDVNVTHDVSDIKLISRDETVISVKNHTITALKKGFSYVHAEYNGVKSEEIRFTVEEKDNTISLSIDTPSKSTLTVDETLTLSVTSNNITDKDSIYLKSSDSNIVSIKGMVLTAKKAGTVKISANYKEYASESIEIKVVDKVTLVLNNPTKTSMFIDETMSFSYELKNATDTNNVNFVSSDPTVATFSNNVLTGLKEGTTKVYATYKDIKSNEITIQILQKEELSLVILTPSKTTLEIDETLTLTKEVKNNYDNLPVTWNSSNSDVLSVDNNGNIKALSIGTSEVTLICGDKTSSPLTITVIAGKPTSFSISFRKNYIGIGEELTPTSTFLPLGSTDTYTLSSSDETKIEIDGNKIIGKKKTSDDEVVTITATTSNGLVTNYQMKVYSIGDSAINELTDLLNTSLSKEKDNVNSGTYKEEEYDGSDELSSKIDDTYTVYNDKLEVKGTYTDSSKTHNTFRSLSIKDDLLYYVDKEDDEYTYYTKAFNLVDGSATGYDGNYNKEEAKDITKLPIFLRQNYSHSNSGVSRNILKKVLDTSYFNCEDAKKAIKFTYIDGVYTISSNYTSTNFSKAYDSKLTLKFVDGLLVSSSGEFVTYTTDDDTSVITDKNKTVKIETTCNSGVRIDSSSDTFDYNSLYYTDYTAKFKKGYGSSLVYTNEYNVGESADLDISETLPSSATDKIDDVVIESVSDSEAATISTSKKSIKFNKAIDNLKVVVTSKKGIKKEFTLKATEVGPTKIGISSTATLRLPSKDVINFERKVSIIPTPSTCKLDLRYEFSQNEAEATVRIDGNYLYIKGTKAGTSTIKIYDSRLPDGAITKTITYYDLSDEGLIKMYNSSTLKCSNNNNISDFSISIDETTKKGTFSFEYAGEVMSADVEAKNNSLVFTNLTDESGDYSLTSIKLGEDAYKGNGYGLIRVVVDDYDNSYNADVYIY